MVCPYEGLLTQHFVVVSISMLDTGRKLSLSPKCLSYTYSTTPGLMNLSNTD